MVNLAWERIIFSRAQSPSAILVLLGSEVNSSHKFGFFFISLSLFFKKKVANVTISVFHTGDPLLFSPQRRLGKHASY